MRFSLGFLFLLVSTVILTPPVSAQQAIVNLPSADITAPGRHFFMHETQSRPQNPGRNWYATNFYAYGVGKNTELAVTMYNFGTPRTANEAVGVGFKTAVPLFENRLPKLELKWTFGQMTVFNTRGKGVGVFGYTHGSVVLPKVKTRLTAGVSAGTNELFKQNTVHAVAGWEQPLVKHKLYFIGEWFSGRHDFGFVSNGVLWHPKKDHIIVLAYKIPNSPRNGKSGLIFEYGLFFGKGKDKGKNPNGQADDDHTALRRIRIEERAAVMDQYLRPDSPSPERTEVE
jgi:hypothetical protein